jgi:hypothetical protein
MLKEVFKFRRPLSLEKRNRLRTYDDQPSKEVTDRMLFRRKISLQEQIVQNSLFQKEAKKMGADFKDLAAHYKRKLDSLKERLKNLKP